MSKRIEVANKPVKVEASTENNILTFTIIGRIWQGELAAALRLNIDNAIAKGIDTVHVLMSSEGGSTFEGEDVKNEFKRMANRKLRIGAICASAATNIATIFGDNVEAYSTSQFMIHKPSSWFSGNEDQVTANLVLLKNITQNYRSVYAKKFSKTEVEIEELWKNDYWMTAAQAKELGLINTIVDENLEYSQETIDAMVACGAPTIPAVPPVQATKPKIENSNKNTMDINLVRAALGMPADATDEQIIAKAKEVKAKADSAATVEASAKQQKAEVAETAINKAILDKKITADMKATYVSLHMQDSVQTDAILASMKGVTAASTTIKETATAEAATGRENWTVEDYLEKDPQAYEALMISDPETVRKMNAVYASKK